MEKKGAATLNQPVNNNTTDASVSSSSSNTKTDNKRNNNNINPNQDLNPKQKKCTSSIYQITGPAHIPTSDVRWQELFLSYDILVHLDRGHIHDDSSKNSSSSSTNHLTMMDQVCKSMAKHARNSSNLAAFAWHLTKMINELLSSCKECCNCQDESNAMNATTQAITEMDDVGANTMRNERHNGHTVMTQSPLSTTGSTTSTLPSANKTTAKIKMVGKARVVCGALNLFRIICHEVIAASFSDMSQSEPLQPPLQSSSSPSPLSSPQDYHQR